MGPRASRRSEQGPGRGCSARRSPRGGLGRPCRRPSPPEAGAGRFPSSGPSNRKGVFRFPVDGRPLPFPAASPFTRRPFPLPIQAPWLRWGLRSLLPVPPARSRLLCPGLSRGFTQGRWFRPDLGSLVTPRLLPLPDSGEPGIKPCARLSFLLRAESTLQARFLSAQASVLTVS